MRWLILATLAGCAGKEDDTAAASFEAGSFQFTSVAVQDNCLDGAFDVLFLPEGAGSESDWAYPVELPAWEDLPSTYTIQLQEPFSDMEITVEEGGADQFALDGAQQTGVEFNADSYPGCLVDLDISATVDIDTEDSVTGTANLEVSNPVGDTCPAFDAVPCDVVLDFYGNRIE